MTPSTTELDLNLRLPNLCVIAHAVQGDALARVITANLYDGSTPWTPPEGAIGVIKFSTALGTSGMYDTDEDGNTAVTWSGNVATLRIVQNAIAVPGDVPMQLKFYDGNEALSTFRWECLVEPSTMTDTEFLQTDYYNILSQQIAAILEVQANIPTPSTSNPAMDGTAAPGTSTTYSRGDHVHPTDTSRAPTNHAKNDTTYGAASTSNYGHVRLSNTTPSMDGTAAVGSSNDVARANHVHPSDTSRVPTTREINGLDLSVDRTLTAENIGYDGTLESHTAGSVGKELGDLSGAINGIRDLRPRAVLGSSDDLDTFYGASATGVYYIEPGVINSPVAYRPLICIGNGNDGFQFIYGSNLLLVRMRTNNTWGAWTSLGQGMLSPYAETSMKATRNYSVNDTIAVNGMLYVAMVTIASGTTLEENTNVKRFVIGQSLNPIAQESTLTDALPNEGQSQYNQNYISKQNNVANIRFRKYGMTARAGNGTVATIPDGYRPQKTQYVWGQVDYNDNTKSMVLFEVKTDGSLSYYATSQSIVTGYWIIGTYPL